MIDEERMISNLADIAAESYRLKGVFSRAVRNAGPGEIRKYMSKFNWFEKKVTAALEDMEMSVVDLTGQKYDPGMAVTPLNLDEFDPDAQLIIDSMMEPVIMQGSRLIRTGTVMLREAPEEDR